MNAEEIIRDLPGTLIGWYDFKAGGSVLFVSGGVEACEVLREELEDRGLKAASADADSLNRVQGSFDYIVAAGVLERAGKPAEMLARLKGLLKASGVLLMGAENRLGLRYFCGDKDGFTGHVFDGIDGYINVNGSRREKMAGRAYSKAELMGMLAEAGFEGFKFYSVLPCLEHPQIILSEHYLPNEALDLRVFPQYHSPETIFLEEERLYASLMENGMFHQMADAYLIEASADGSVSDVDQATVQGDRGREEAMATVIRGKKSVTKKALYPEGRHKTEALAENAEYLKRHGVPLAAGRLEGDAYVMPYIEGQIATEYFRELLRKDKESFLEELGKFRRIIETSSEQVPYEEVNWKQFEPGWEKRKKDDPNLDYWERLAQGSEEDRRGIGVILRRGYVDMVSINCFHTDKGFLFFDQEFYAENFPANAVFIRTIDFIYRDSPDLERIWPQEELLKELGLLEHRETWRRAGAVFLERILNAGPLAGYYRQHRRDWRTVGANRHRMDYTQEEYDRLFSNLFKGLENKKMYLFGSGHYAEEFIRQFGEYYEIAGIFDNARERWGSSLRGIKILPPEDMGKIKEPFKVFLCIKFFEEVLEQLKAMGVRDVSVYYPERAYERPLKLETPSSDAGPKKYHIGYVAGVFDLFHIGHLNLLKRAKEQCDYLIVGVVTDEQVIKNKKTKPYIPFQERREIVQACRYVDEAVEIPMDSSDTEDAFRRYHFDVQFSGSDYENDPAWLSKKLFLRQHGADLVFFPYTQSTSSTEIKEQIGDRV